MAGCAQAYPVAVVVVVSYSSWACSVAVVVSYSSQAYPVAVVVVVSYSSRACPLAVVVVVVVPRSSWRGPCVGSRSYVPS